MKLTGIEWMVFTAIWIAVIGLVVGLTFTVRACSDVQDRGLKNALNEIWEGDQ